MNNSYKIGNCDKFVAVNQLIFIQVNIECILINNWLSVLKFV